MRLQKIRSDLSVPIVFLYVLVSTISTWKQEYQGYDFYVLKHIFVIIVLATVFSLRRAQERILPITLLVLLFMYSVLLSDLPFLIFASVLVAILLGSYRIAETNVIMFAVGAVLTVSAIYASIEGETYALYGGERTRLELIFANPNYLAQYCAIMIVFLLRRIKSHLPVLAVLFFVLWETGSRSAIVALVIVLIFTVPLLWSKNKSISGVGLRALNAYLFCHAFVYVMLFYGLWNYDHYSDVFSAIGAVTSNRPLIWSYGVSEVGLFGGADPSINYLSWNVAAAREIGERVSVDSYYVSRFLEAGVLAFIEYGLILILLYKAFRTSTTREIQILIFFATIGFSETIGIGAGSLGAILYTSILINRGGVWHKNTTRYYLSQPNG